MSTKEELMHALLVNAAEEVEMMDSSDSEIDEVMDDVTEDILVTMSMRYHHRSKVPKNMSWYEETLQQLDDKRFKMLLRCTREKFNIILNLIKDHPVFHETNSHKQFTTYLQLAVVMFRLGSNGTGAQIGKIATLFGIGDGGTIDKITWRVFKAVLALETQYIYWPSDEEKTEIISETSQELPHCIGYIDATEIPLEYTPSDDHESYFSRNRIYSIKMQAVCDYKLKIRHVVIGWPGSVHDARIFSESKLAMNPDEFFSGEEWLAADSAYTLSTKVITPFRKNSNALTHNQRAKFNKFFSSKRVRIENVFGICKNIFMSLKQLKIYVSKISHEFACAWVRVCCILYNILVENSHEDELEEYLPASKIVEYEDEGLLTEEDDLAEAKRLALYSIIFNEDV